MLTALLLGLSVVSLIILLLLFWLRAICAAPAWRALYGGPPDGSHRIAFAGEQRELAFQSACDAAGARTVVLDTILATCDPGLVKPLLQSRAHSLGRSWMYRALANVLPNRARITIHAPRALRMWM